MLKNLNITPGLVFAFILSNAVLPVRLMEGQAKDIVNLVGSQIVIFFLCLLCWLWVVHVLRFQNMKQGLKIFISMLGCAILSILFYYGSNHFFEDFPLDPLKNHSIYVGLRRMAYRGILVGVILYPAAYFLDTQRRMHIQLIRMEQKKRHNLQMELTYLRQQMNPHFLFNALNVLKSGANEDWVKEYTLRLSGIYRYFLEQDMKTDLVQVATELKFIDAYIYILKQRFGDGFDVEFLLNDQEMQMYIPPLSIQTLIENAINHNITSLEQPLKVSVFEENGHIVISNIKRKRISSTTSGTGLKNLAERYRLLSDKSLIIEDDGPLFIVKLPLLKDDRNNN